MWFSPMTFSYQDTGGKECWERANTWHYQGKYDKEQKT